MSIIDQKRFTDPQPKLAFETRLIALLRAWKDRMRRARSRRAAIRSLAALDDLILDDVGVVRGELSVPKRSGSG